MKLYPFHTVYKGINNPRNVPAYLFPFCVWIRCDQHPFNFLTDLPEPIYRNVLIFNGFVNRDKLAVLNIHTVKTRIPRKVKDMAEGGGYHQIKVPSCYLQNLKITESPGYRFAEESSYCPRLIGRLNNYKDWLNMFFPFDDLLTCKDASHLFPVAVNLGNYLGEVNLISFSKNNVLVEPPYLLSEVVKGPPVINQNKAQTFCNTSRIHS